MIKKSTIVVEGADHINIGSAHNKFCRMSYSYIHWLRRQQKTLNFSIIKCLLNKKSYERKFIENTLKRIN
jgi:hypothetical protein